MTTKRTQEAREKLKAAILKRMSELDAELGYRITETEFAERAGCPQPLMNLWKSGKGLPSSQYILSLSREIPGIYDIMGLAHAGMEGNSDLSVPPDFSPGVLGRLRQLILWMKDLTEEERLTVLEEALQYGKRRKRVRPATAEHNKRV